jgi:hypothetical protein
MASIVGAPLFGEMPVMSETLNTQTRSKPARSGSADLQMMAQVEKWMATIREISREQQDKIKTPAS